MAYQHDPSSGLPMRTAIATFAPPTDDRLRFIKQLGVDDLIIWGTTFRTSSSGSNQLVAAGPPELTYKEPVALRSRVEDAGLRLFAIESLRCVYPRCQGCLRHSDPNMKGKVRPWNPTSSIATNSPSLS